MSNINLTTSNDNQESGGGFYGTGIAIMVVILFILGVLYGGIFWMSKKAKADKDRVIFEYGEELKILKSDKNRDIVDFQNRINLATELIDKKSLAYASLPGVEGAVVPGVFLTTYNFDADTQSIAIEGIADDFYVFSKQILSFKKSEYFSEVTTGESSLDKNGKVSFSLVLKIK